MGLNWGTVAMPRELKSSEGVNAEGEGGHTQGSHTWGARDTGQTRDRAHARRTADGFVRVDVAQSALREARSLGTPRMHGRPGRGGGGVTGVSFAFVISLARVSQVVTWSTNFQLVTHVTPRVGLNGCLILLGEVVSRGSLYSSW